MKLQKEEVEHVGKLARLHLTEDEVEAFSQQLSSILSYMDTLNEIRSYVNKHKLRYSIYNEFSYRNNKLKVERFLKQLEIQ